MKTVNYQQLADVLEWCVQYAKKLKVNMEDPDGKRKNFQISDISITLLNYHSKAILFKDGIAGEAIALDQSAEMFIQIWIENKQKKIKQSFGIAEIFLDPDYLKMFFIGAINTYIKSSINRFFAMKIKDNKHSVVSDEETVVDIPVLAPLDEISDDGIHQVEKLFRWLYVKTNVIATKGGLSNQRKVWIVCNSKGTKIIQYQDRCNISLDFTYLSIKKNLIEDKFVDYFKTFQEVLDSLSEIKVKLSKKLAKMEMKRIDSGIYPILLKPAAVCTLFHEAIAGHMLSAKYILNGNSTVFENKLGKKFANNGDMPGLDWISIYDKPLEESMTASYKYDIEGTPSKNVCLFYKGIVRNYLTDRNTAKRLKQKSNGHYISESFVGVDENGEAIIIMPEPRVSNLIIESHTDISIDEIRESIFEEFDWYLEVESRSGAVFVDTGTFDLFADNVTRVYKDGRRESVNSGTLSSNLTDFLATIQMVSNHYGESKGVCGSNSGYVPTHSKAPAMFLYGINFVSEAKPERFLEINIDRDKFIPESFNV
jgi:predicted Zn-dependent protease